MRVLVRLAGHLNSYASAREVTVEMEAGSRVRDLVAALGIPAGEVGSSYLEGRGALLDACLRDGCKVELFPPIAGGAPWGSR